MVEFSLFAQVSDILDTEGLTQTVAGCMIGAKVRGGLRRNDV